MGGGSFVALCWESDFVADPMLIARGDTDQYLLPKMSNRHGLVAGATGTGKTVTIHAIAEQFSRIGVPVFVADVKGDLSGISQAGGDNEKVAERVKQLNVENFAYEASPVMFWDLYGKLGHPIRATISEMGPLLLSRLLNLSDAQSGVLQLVFRYADDNGLLLLDLKDLRSLLQYLGDNRVDRLPVPVAPAAAVGIGHLGQQVLTDRYRPGR